MIELNDREIKEVSLEVLAEFDRVCRLCRATYSLYAGSLLGAVRHKGMIPWDDDIDVVMMRSEYEKLIDSKEYIDDKFRLISLDDPGYSLPLAKLVSKITYLDQYYHYSHGIELGIYVDIFILDYVPENDTERHALYERVNRLQNRWQKFEIRPKKTDPTWKRVLKDAGNRINMARYFAKKMEKLASHRPNSPVIANLMYEDIPRDKGLIRAREFEDLTMLQFESLMLPCFANYDNVLRVMYGEYMKLPPVEKRISNHSYKVYWTDRD